MDIPFVRSKGPTLRLRDAESGKMKPIGHVSWVAFGALPKGMPPVDGCDCEVRIAKCEEDLKAIEAENGRREADAEARRASRGAKPPTASATVAEGEPDAEKPTESKKSWRKGHK